MGDITGDLSSRRGKVSNTDVLSGGFVTVKGQVPLAEIEDYQSKLKSMTGGEGSYSVEFAHYDVVPGNTQQQVITRLRAEMEKEKEK